MSSLRKTITELVRGSLKVGANVSFTETELKGMGIKVPKSKLHLVKQPEQSFKICSFKLPVRTIDQLKKKALASHKPYNVFVSELLATAAR